MKPVDTNNRQNRHVGGGINADIAQRGESPETPPFLRKINANGRGAVVVALARQHKHRRANTASNLTSPPSRACLEGVMNKTIGKREVAAKPRQWNREELGARRRPHQRRRH